MTTLWLRRVAKRVSRSKIATGCGNEGISITRISRIYKSALWVERSRRREARPYVRRAFLRSADELDRCECELSILDPSLYHQFDRAPRRREQPSIRAPHAPVGSRRECTSAGTTVMVMVMVRESGEAPLRVWRIVFQSGHDYLRDRSPKAFDTPVRF